jgi:hypothetical protein
MNRDIIQLLTAQGQGEPHAASRLLQLACEELGKLAGQRMAEDQPGQTRAGGFVVE